MKFIIKLIVSALAILGIFFILIKIEQYNCISFIAGTIWGGIYLLLCEYIDK